MGVTPRQPRQEDKMQYLVLATVATLASARPQAVLPAGLSAAACPNYPFCGAETPADFPTPVVNGEPIAPILNTNPAQTQFYQQSQLATAPADFPVPVINGENVAPGYNTVPAQTAAQSIQHRIQQQEIEAARPFGRL